jgi:hypothetical protein
MPEICNNIKDGVTKKNGRYSMVEIYLSAAGY